jgi:hypothetical protein
MPIDVDNARPDRPGLRERKLEKALRRKGIAVCESRKSMVLPVEAMARYRYVQRPATRM